MYLCLNVVKMLRTTDVGFLLVIIGFALALIGMVILVVRSPRGQGSAKGAGVLLIGPIPIVFGTDKQSVKLVMILAIVLILAALVVMLLPAFVGR
jgi:uncharacterized protein (TIGR00304 family)